ncbi:MAG: hypothetical protein HRT69_07655 [Flavobacteriaceae bacterium]|nr:hypothetical protein [Flavobacteriaceae bacterium]
MKTYTKHNFFKHTYCEFIEVSEDIFMNNTAHYKSNSDSLYHYTPEGVYRYSDHWGRVANCRWKLLANDDFKSQVNHLGFSKWSDFYAINDTEKLFYLEVDFEFKKVNFKHKAITNGAEMYLFTAQEAQKRQKQIRILLKEERWAKYYDQDIEDLRLSIISQLISTNKTLQELKLAHK